MIFMVFHPKKVEKEKLL